MSLAQNICTVLIMFSVVMFWDLLNSVLYMARADESWNQQVFKGSYANTPKFLSLTIKKLLALS